MPSTLKTAAEDAATFMRERWSWVMSEKQRERESMWEIQKSCSFYWKQSHIPTWQTPWSWASPPSQFFLSETSLWRDGESKCLRVTKMMERKKGRRKKHKVREGGQRTDWESKAVRDARSSLHFSVLSPRPFTPPSPLRVWWRSRCSCSQHCQRHLGGRRPTDSSSSGWKTKNLDQINIKKLKF